MMSEYLKLKHEEIALRAYNLWELSGKPDGDPNRFWYKAENSLTKERQLAYSNKGWREASQQMLAQRRKDPEFTPLPFPVNNQKMTSTPLFYDEVRAKFDGAGNLVSHEDNNNVPADVKIEFVENERFRITTLNNIHIKTTDDPLPWYTELEPKKDT